MNTAYFSLVTSDSYVAGAECLGYSIFRYDAHRPRVLMVTENVSHDAITRLEKYWEIATVPSIASPLKTGIDEWDHVGYSKLNVWGFTQFHRILYIDADAIVVEDVSDLFDMDVPFAAAPDVLPPDKFNAGSLSRYISHFLGVMLLTPSRDILSQMLHLAPTLPTHDGGDTGFLNSFFPHWFFSAGGRLPFGYNAQRAVHRIAQKRRGYWDVIRPLKIIHFSSFPKPWEGGVKDELERLWWSTYALARTSTLR